MREENEIGDRRTRDGELAHIGYTYFPNDAKHIAIRILSYVGKVNLLSIR